PCSVYTCMAGVSGVGTPGGTACTAPIVAFHAIQVWDPEFDSGSTAAARRQFLMTCPGVQEPTNLATLNVIIAHWGYSPCVDPSVVSLPACLTRMSHKRSTRH